MLTSAVNRYPSRERNGDSELHPRTEASSGSTATSTGCFVSRCSSSQRRRTSIVVGTSVHTYGDDSIAMFTMSTMKGKSASVASRMPIVFVAHSKDTRRIACPSTLVP